MRSNWSNAAWLTLLYLAVYVSGTSALDGSICSDELNPFNLDVIRNFEVPMEESTERTIWPEPWILHWIPRDILGCDENHNASLKESVRYSNPLGQKTAVEMLDNCKAYVQNWVSSVVEIVRKNLLVTMRFRSILLTNNYKILKSIVFKDKFIYELSPEDLAVGCKDLTRIVNGGYSIRDEKVARPQDFTELSENVRIFEALSRENTNRDYGYYCTKDIKTSNNYDSSACLLGLYKLIVGENKYTETPNNFINGWPDLKIALEEGIRSVRRFFGKSNNSFSRLRIPLTSECFNLK